MELPYERQESGGNAFDIFVANVGTRAGLRSAYGERSIEPSARRSVPKNGSGEKDKASGARNPSSRASTK